jgi:hypothetical protein
MPARLRRLAALAALSACSAVAVAAPGAAVAAPTAPAASSPGPGPGAVLSSDVRIEKFVVNKSGLVALGTQSARLDGNAARQKATFAVSKGGSCNVLTLNLQQLHLQLLGLDLATSAINLKITGRGSQSLGALFCKLSRSLKLTSASSGRAAAASLNRYLHGHPLHAVRFRATLPVVTAQAAQSPAPPPSCKVLDLVLGPLNLDLLGLVVDLYGPDASKPVEVHVTANPAGGVLGAVFCKLANGQAVG